MPALSYLDDQDVADVVTFVINSWDNAGGEVNSAQIAAARGGEMVSEPAKHPGTESMAYQGAPSAVTGEGEIFEMFGVYFEGHPDNRRLLLPEDWADLPPLRKDFAIKGR